MSSSISSTSVHRWATEEPSLPPVRGALADPLSREPVQVGRAFARFLITFCIGVIATLTWQSYGSATREMIASLSPRLGWLGSPAASVGQAALAAASPDQEEFKAISFGLAGVQQRVDQIATQLAAGQEQITNKLQEVEQNILDKISAPPQQPAATPARKPVPLTPLQPPVR